MTDGPYRISTDHAGQANASAAVSITVDGEAIPSYVGEPLAAALLASGRRVCRTTEAPGAARGIFCATGVCGDCAMQVDGIPGVRACVTPVRAGMRVETQRGLSDWSLLPTAADVPR